jgi:hypothetical protein
MVVVFMQLRRMRTVRDIVPSAVKADKRDFYFLENYTMSRPDHVQQGRARQGLFEKIGYPAFVHKLYDTPGVYQGEEIGITNLRFESIETSAC